MPNLDDRYRRRRRNLAPPGSRSPAAPHGGGRGCQQNTVSRTRRARPSATSRSRTVSGKSVGQPFGSARRPTKGLPRRLVSRLRRRRSARCWRARRHRYTATPNGSPNAAVQAQPVCRYRQRLLKPFLIDCSHSFTAGGCASGCIGRGTKHQHDLCQFPVLKRAAVVVAYHADIDPPDVPPSARDQEGLAGIVARQRNRHPCHSSRLASSPLQRLRKAGQILRRPVEKGIHGAAWRTLLLFGRNIADAAVERPARRRRPWRWYGSAAWCRCRSVSG